jgi:hypothetical protein
MPMALISFESFTLKQTLTMLDVIVRCVIIHVWDFFFGILLLEGQYD